jgi:hypothetical protein
MLGHQVTIVEFAPLQVMSYDSGGCFPTTSGAPGRPTVTHPPAGPCHHYHQALGWGRVWIDRDHATILRYEERGIADLHNVLGTGIRARYGVTSVTFGRGPTPAELAYRPPVPPRVAHGQPVGFDFPATYQSYTDDRVPGFLDAPDPDAMDVGPYRRLATTTAGPDARAGVLPPQVTILRVPVMDVLFAQVRHWVPVFTTWHGQADIYVKGPYLLVQERRLPHGLPATFRTDTGTVEGACRIWTGTYADGQRWLAFRRGAISVVLSTNSVSQRRLRHYASKGMCS